MWYFAIDDLKGYEFLKAMKPYMLVKTQECRVALAFLAHRRRAIAERKKSARGKGLCLFIQHILRGVISFKTILSNLNKKD